MNKLHISDAPLYLPVDWMTLATVVYGARGSGKTTLGAVCAEEVFKAGQRFGAIDLKGDWWGLRSSADGKSAGIPLVIFGGDHADLPLEEDAGAFVAETVAALEQSFILDLEHLSKGKQTRFLAQFFETLYHVNREPLLLFLDESQRYAPQKTFSPEGAKCLGAVEDLVKLGRKHGIGVVVITQRGAGLNKEISELCDMLVACRTPGPLDQERIRGWLEANVTKDQRDYVMSTLAGLKTGTAVFASGHPDLKVFDTVAVRRRTTFDSSATPKVGQRRVEPKLLAKPDLDVLKKKMAAAIERSKANDPKALHARIAELEKENEKLSSRSGDTEYESGGLHKRIKELEDELAEVQGIEVPVLTDEQLGDMRGLVQRMEAAQEGGAEIVKTLVDAIERTTREMVQTRLMSHRVVPEAPRPRVPTTPQPRAYDAPAANQTLKRGARDILVAVAASKNGRTRSQVATIAGIKATGSTLASYMSNLRGAGYIEERGDLITPTRAGLAEAKRIDPSLHVLTLDELRAMWLSKFKRGARMMLEELLAKYPRWIERNTLAEKLGIETTGSTLASYVSNLASAGVVEKDGALLRASPSFFVEG